MGRSPIGTKPMTAAERQRRRRRRLRADRTVQARRKKQDKNIEPNLPLAARAERVVSRIAKALEESPSLSIDDIRAAIERRWPRPTAVYRGRADGRAAEAKQTANDSEYDKIRQDADAYRLEQARAILQALGHKENEDGTFSPPSARL